MQKSLGGRPRGRRGYDGLTDKERQTYRLLFETLSKTGRVPTYSEIARIYSVSKHAIASRLRSLEKRGLVKLSGGFKTSIEIVGCKVVIICEKTPEGIRAKAIYEGRPEDIPIEFIQQAEETEDCD